MMAKKPSTRPWSHLSLLRPEPIASPFAPSLNAPSQATNTANKINTEIEQKKIPVEEKPKTAPVNNITRKPSNINDHDGSLHKAFSRKISDLDTEDSGSIIKIAGQNKGAYMEMIQTPKNKSQKVRTRRNGVYINSNVQCVNNSMLLHTSSTHHDPGMHLTLSKKPFGKGFFLKEQVNGPHN